MMCQTFNPSMTHKWSFEYETNMHIIYYIAWGIDRFGSKVFSTFFVM